MRVEHHYGRFMQSRAADRAEIEKMFPRAFDSEAGTTPESENNPTQTPREQKQRIHAGGKEWNVYGIKSVPTRFAP